MCESKVCEEADLANPRGIVLFLDVLRGFFQPSQLQATNDEDVSASEDDSAQDAAPLSGNDNDSDSDNDDDAVQEEESDAESARKPTLTPPKHAQSFTT